MYKSEIQSSVPSPSQSPLQYVNNQYNPVSNHNKPIYYDQMQQKQMMDMTHQHYQMPNKIQHQVAQSKQQQQQHQIQQHQYQQPQQQSKYYEVNKVSFFFLNFESRSTQLLARHFLCNTLVGLVH